MTDRRTGQNNIYHGQWGGVGQQYDPASLSSYSPSSYQSNATGQHIIQPQQLLPSYGGNTPIDDEPAYHSNVSIYSPSDSPPGAMQTNYTHHGMSPDLRQSHLSSRSGHSHSHSHSYPHSHSHSRSHSQVHPFAQQQPQSQAHDLQSRPRSHSQTRPYISSHIPPVATLHHPSSQSPAQVPFAQSISISPLSYPATPPRPFACDICALSFNRQHDLKRHRDTHTGEKPYLCNGGCGKTFTRKDALKRHQLVKACGSVDET